MFSKRSKTNWLMTSSAVLGGFLLGFSYKKFGKEISNRIQNMTSNMGNKKLHYDDDYISSHEPDA
jgi:hypothetical protein